MSRFNLLCMFTFCTCFAARDPPTVKIPDQGTLMGREVSRSRVQKIIGYYGIPYAQPPKGDLRFAPPVTDPLPSWDGVRNATEYRPACLQTEKDIREEAKGFLNLTYPNYESLEMDEDCLYLNVFVPFGKPPDAGFATIIWIHPGNFTTGSPSMWNPHTLVFRQRVIVVTVAWRLNIMGFFTTMDGEAPGNFGLLDQQAAMMWVNKNIKLFGGNPSNVCLMGYGTGGVSVGLHMVNPTSQNYFSKVIIMSANLLSPSLVKDPKEDRDLLNRLAKGSACDRTPTSRFIDCLRNVDGRSLVTETSNINWRPLIDANLSNRSNPFLADLPRNYFERGDFHKVPCLTGYTNMEDILGVTSLIDGDYASYDNISRENMQQLISDIISGDVNVANNTDCSYNLDHITNSVMFFYGPSSDSVDMDDARKIIADLTTERNYAAYTFLHASYISRENSTFVYRFDTKPSTSWALGNLPDWISVPHLYDLIYVWGMPYWQEFDGRTWETRDRRFSDIIMSFWTNFAKSSDPTEGLLYRIRWDQFKKDTPDILIMDGSFNMSNSKNLNYKAFEFWNDYHPKVVDQVMQCCNTHDDARESHRSSYLAITIFQIILCYIFI